MERFLAPELLIVPIGVPNFVLISVYWVRFVTKTSLVTGSRHLAGHPIIDSITMRCERTMISMDKFHKGLICCFSFWRSAFKLSSRWQLSIVDYPSSVWWMSEFSWSKPFMSQCCSDLAIRVMNTSYLWKCFGNAWTFLLFHSGVVGFIQVFSQWNSAVKFLLNRDWVGQLWSRFIRDFTVEFWQLLAPMTGQGHCLAIGRKCCWPSLIPVYGVLFESGVFFRRFVAVFLRPTFSNDLKCRTQGLQILMKPQSINWNWVMNIN